MCVCGWTNVCVSKYATADYCEWCANSLSFSIIALSFILSLFCLFSVYITFSQLTIYYRICWHLPSSHDNCERGRETGEERERERGRAQPHLRLFSQLENIFFVCFVVSFCCCCFWKFKLRPYAIIGVIKFLFAEIKWYVSSPVICLGARSLDLISQSLSVMFLFRCQT